MTTILDVPCVYRFVGRDRHRNRRERLAIDRMAIELPELAHLPEPMITVEVEGGWSPYTVDYYAIRGGLLRPVMIEPLWAQQATIDELESATLLVSPQHPLEQWFDHHPSSIRRIPRRGRSSIHDTTLDDLDRFRVLASDLETRREETADAWAACAVHGGVVLAPSRPPTRTVKVHRDLAYVAAAWDWEPPFLPTFHFGFDDGELSTIFAAAAVGDGQVETSHVHWRYPSDLPNRPSGALETAQEFAFRYCHFMSGRRIHRTDRDWTKVFMGLRELYERGGTDEQAEAVLSAVVELDRSSMPQDLRPWHELLRLRRALLDDYAALAELAP